MTDITLDTVVRKSEEIFTGTIDNEIVAMSIQNGKYYHLNETGSNILAMLDQPHSISEICQVMAGRYRVDETTCRQDVIEFMRKMSRYNLVLVE